MLRFTSCRSTRQALYVLLALGGTGVSAAAADGGLEMIETPGSGALTMCRSWFFFNSCQSYNHVELPARITVGDRVTLVFGSNTKQVGFQAGRITRNGDRCTIYQDPGATSGDDVDRIEIDSCRMPPLP